MKSMHYHTSSASAICKAKAMQRRMLGVAPNAMEYVRGMTMMVAKAGSASPALVPLDAHGIHHHEGAHCDQRRTHRIGRDGGCR